MNNYDDITDSRDVITRIEELEGTEDRDDEEQIELDTLRDFAAEAEGYCEDWEHGAQLIRDTYFTTYAQELGEDVMDVSCSWPFTCIDWDQAARELKMDYTAVEFDGVTYWVR